MLAQKNLGIHFDKYYNPKIIKGRAYYVSAPLASVRKPPQDTAWWKEISARNNLLRTIKRKSSNIILNDQ